MEETGKGDGCTINLPHETVEELFEKHFDLFKKVPMHLCELFYDQKLEEWNDTNVATISSHYPLFFPPFYHYYKSGPYSTTERAIQLGRLF